MHSILFVWKPPRILFTSELRNLNVCVYTFMSTRGFEVLVIGSGGLVNAEAQRAFQVACAGRLISCPRWSTWCYLRCNWGICTMMVDEAGPTGDPCPPRAAVEGQEGCASASYHQPLVCSSFWALCSERSWFSLSQVPDSIDYHMAHLWPLTRRCLPLAFIIWAEFLHETHHWGPAFTSLYHTRIAPAGSGELLE